MTTAVDRRPPREVPPHDLAAEESLLGAMLLSREPVVVTLEPEDFYSPAHGHVFAAARSLYATGHPVDPVTVADVLRRTGLLDAIGGPASLTDLQAATPAISNASRYAAIVASCALQRRMMALGAEVAAAAADGDLEATAAILEDGSQVLAGKGSGLCSTWEPVDLGTVDGAGSPPGLWHRDDGVGLLYPGALNSFLGASESCKSWAAIAATAEVVAAGGTVLYIDHEDTPVRMVERLESLGTNVASAWGDGRLAYVRPDEPPSPATIRNLARRAWTLVVIDGVTEAMVTAGLSLLDNDDVARFYTSYARPFAAEGSAVVMVDHITKSAETAGAIGGQHKRAGISGVSLLFTVAVSPSSTTEGVVHVTVDKDRHHGIRAHAQGRMIATMHLVPAAGRLRVTMAEPTVRGPDRSKTFTPTAVMAQLARTIGELEAEGLEATARRLDDRVRSHVRGIALDRLIAGGYVAVERGPRGKTVHRLLRPFDRNTYAGPPIADNDETSG